MKDADGIAGILDQIDDLLESSWDIPLTGGRCVVDAEQVQKLVADARVMMPAEIRRARAIISDRNRVLSMAKGEAEDLIRKSEERAKSLLDQQNIVRQANAKAMALLNEAAGRAARIVEEATRQADTVVAEATRRANGIMANADTRSHEMKQASYDFSDGMLSAAEALLTSSLEEVTATRRELEKAGVKAGLREKPTGDG